MTQNKKEKNNYNEKINQHNPWSAFVHKIRLH